MQFKQKPSWFNFLLENSTFFIWLKKLNQMRSKDSIEHSYFVIMKIVFKFNRCFFSRTNLEHSQNFKIKFASSKVFAISWFQIVWPEQSIGNIKIRFLAAANTANFKQLFVDELNINQSKSYQIEETVFIQLIHLYKLNFFYLNNRLKILFIINQAR